MFIKYSLPQIIYKNEPPWAQNIISRILIGQWLQIVDSYWLELTASANARCCTHKRPTHYFNIGFLSTMSHDLRNGWRLIGVSIVSVVECNVRMRLRMVVSVNWLKTNNYKNNKLDRSQTRIQPVSAKTGISKQTDSKNNIRWSYD